MSEVRRIEDQLRRAFEGQAWHGDSLMELLSGVTANQAAAKPLKDVHSIWEIVLHIAFWDEVSRRRAEGDEARVENLADGWTTPSETTEANWQQTLDNLRQTNEALCQTIAKLDDQRLKESAAGQPYSIYFMFHGVIQHTLYHAGQIALLKKVLNA